MVGGTVRRTVSTTTYTSLCYGTCAVISLLACLGAGAAGHVVSPTVVSLVLLPEVPGAALLAGLFLGQTPPGVVYVGVALIMAGLALVVLRGQPTSGEVPLD